MLGFLLGLLCAVDAVKKIKTYGIVMLVSGLVDLIIVFIVSKYSITGNTLILICLPVIIGVMYLGGAFYNEKLIKGKSDASDKNSDVEGGSND